MPFGDEVRPAASEAGQLPQERVAHARGVGLADLFAEPRGGASEIRGLVELTGQERDDGSARQRSPPAAGVAEVLSGAAVALELTCSRRVAELEQRRRLQQLGLSEQLAVTGEPGEVEHLGNDRDAFACRSDRPAGVVERQEAEGEGGRVVERACDLHRVGGDGAGPVVRPWVPGVVQLAGQSGQCPGPQR